MTLGDRSTGSSLILVAPRLFLGTEEPLRENSYVWLEDGRIREVGGNNSVASLVPPESVEIRSYKDCTVMPGLVDAHTHLTLFANRQPYEAMAREADEMMALVALRNALVHLKSGVTTLRDNGGRNRVTFILREAVGRGYFVGPRMLLAGRPVTHSRGHFHWCNGVADGADEIQKQVRVLIAEGADHIKLMASGGGTDGTERHLPSYTAAELRVAVETAHSLGRLTTAHCHSKESMVNALEAGLDCIEHGEFNVLPSGADVLPGMTFGQGRLSGHFHSETTSYDSEIVHRLVSSSTFLSFTMQAGGFEKLLELRDLKVASGTLPESMARFHDMLERKFETKQMLLSKLLDDGMGALMPISSDAGCYDGSFGRLDLGVGLAVEAGMDASQALRAITSIAATACGVGDRVGTLEPGKEADIAVFAGNPLQDIRSLRNVRDVYIAGERLVESGEAVTSGLGTWS